MARVIGDLTVVGRTFADTIFEKTADNGLDLVAERKVLRKQLPE
jgi:hypothetical protein